MSTFSLEDRMDALERQHFNLQVNFTQLEKKLTAKLEDVSTKLQDLKDDMTEGFNQRVTYDGLFECQMDEHFKQMIDDRFDEVYTYLKQQDEHQLQVERQTDARFKMVKEHFKQVSVSFKEVDTRFNQIDERFKKVDERFEKLEGQMEARFKQVDERFNQIDERFEQIDARFKQIDERFKQVDARFKQIDARFEQVDARFEKVETRLDRMESLLTQILARLPG